MNRRFVRSACLLLFSFNASMRSERAYYVVLCVFVKGCTRVLNVCTLRIVPGSRVVGTMDGWMGDGSARGRMASDDASPPGEVFLRARRRLRATTGGDGGGRDDAVTTTAVPMMMSAVEALVSAGDADSRSRWTRLARGGVETPATIGDGDDGDGDVCVSVAAAVREDAIRAMGLMKIGDARGALARTRTEAFARAEAKGELSFAAMAIRAEALRGVNEITASMDAFGALHAMCGEKEKEAKADSAERSEWRRRRNATALAMARGFMADGNPRSALVWLDALARDEPENPSHLSSAGRAHLMMGDLEGARLCFESAEKTVARLGKAASDEQRLSVLRDRGELLLTSLKFSEAKDAFDAAMNKYETDVAAMVNGAVAAVYGGDLDSSRALLEKRLLLAQDSALGSDALNVATPSVVKNLNSIYELTARAPAEAKHSMGSFVKEFALCDFDASCVAT